VNSAPAAAAKLEHASPAMAIPDWRWPLAALVLALLAIVGLYSETAIAMVKIWYHYETFTHAFLVPPIVLWLVWRRRHVLMMMPPKPAPVVLIPMAAVALAWLLGDLTAVNSITQLAFVAMLALVVPAVLGLRIAYAVLFPLFFLFFSVPIGEFLMPQFMLWTADFTVAALRLSGIPVLREGLQFVIPSGNWSVVEACSGIRYLIASVTVGTLYAHLNYQSTQRRVAFVLVSVIAPVLANWVRAYIIVMLGHLSGNTLAVGVDHLIYGWVFFGIVILLMFIVGARWAQPEPPLPPICGHRVSEAPLGLQVAFLFAVAGVLLVTAWPTVARWWIDGRESSRAVELAAPASLSPAWPRVAAPAYTYKPNFENPSAEVDASFGQPQQEVGLYIAYYRNQNYGRKLVSSSNVLVTSENRNWASAASGERKVALGSTRASVRAAQLRSLKPFGPDRNDRLVVWQIYWINGTLTSSNYAAKVYSAVYRLLGLGDESAVIVIHAQKPITGDPDAPLEAFMQANFAAIDALLQQVSASR
jgi:exosortase A